MGKIQKLIKYVIDADYRFAIDSRFGKYDSMPDEEFLKRRFRSAMGKELDLENPQTFNEKLQWLKLYDCNPEYTRIVDKYEFKNYIAEKIGAEYTVPTLGRWDSFDDIDFDSLPDKFVLKCNHDSGTLVICKDKSKLDVKKARKKLSKALKKDFYLRHREWPYKDVKPCIIAEKYLDLSDPPIEYKLFSFNGSAKIILVCKGIAHTSNRTNTFYDRDFNKLPIQSLLPNQIEKEEKPAEYEKLLEIADKLSEGIPQVRVDFYISDGQIYVGEMTFFHNAGFCKINPEEWDKKMGDMIPLDIVKKYN